MTSGGAPRSTCRAQGMRFSLLIMPLKHLRFPSKPPFIHSIMSNALGTSQTEPGPLIPKHLNVAITSP